MSPELRRAAKQDDATAFVQAWRRQVFGKTKSGTKLPSGLCRWSLYDMPEADPLVGLTRSVFPEHEKQSGDKIRSAIKTGRTPTKPLTDLTSHLLQKSERWTPAEIITAGELLIAFPKDLEPSQIGSLWKRFAKETRSPSSEPAAETPDQLLLRSGEVPFLAGCLLEPWRDAKKLRNRGQKLLIKELIARTDSDGTPHAELLPRIALWLAPLIRATLWAERFGHPLWSDDDRRRLSLVLERAIPLCRPNGRLAMSNGLVIPALPLFDVAAKSLSLTGPAEKLLRNLRANPKPTLHKRTRGDVQLMPSNQSDWARFAMLRSDWSAHSDSLAISHHQPLPQLDVAVLGQSFLHGAWGLELQIGDAVIEPAEEWACTCWCSDPDADYLELQMSGPGQLCVERQVLLSRKEHFLMLADCVRGARSLLSKKNGSAAEQQIHLRSRLPLADGVTREPDQLSREIQLKARKQTVRVFPLALPNDRVHSTPHTCRVDGHELVLHQVGSGNGLCAPLIFDWHPARTRQPALWRTLTVTEGGKVIGRDLAAGHRLQIGKYQLLIYRSLSEINAARAVLGHHTWHESVIARVDTKGDVDDIMKVDP